MIPVRLRKNDGATHKERMVARRQRQLTRQPGFQPMPRKAHSISFKRMHNRRLIVVGPAPMQLDQFGKPLEREKQLHFTKGYRVRAA